MIQLKITRSTVKKQLIAVVERLGPKMDPEFKSVRELRNKGLLDNDSDLRL
jgi:hypothetical protein